MTEGPHTSSPDIDDILAQQPILKEPSSTFIKKGRTVLEAQDRVLSSSSQLSASSTRNHISYAYDGFNDAEDYGEPDGTNGECDLKLERALEGGVGSDGARFDDVDSDLSIDIHTPLSCVLRHSYVLLLNPDIQSSSRHLMLRYGLLSPNAHQCLMVLGRYPDVAGTTSRREVAARWDLG